MKTLNAGVLVMNVENSDNLRLTFRGSKVELKQLRLAVVAADLGSFRQAAEASLIKQSTFSRSVRQLEHVVGVPLFARARTGIRPTPAGRTFLTMSRSILAQIDALVDTVRANGRGGAGRLAVGFCTSLSAGNLRATLVDLKQRHPQIELATVERSRTGLAAALQNGGIDVLIVTGRVSLLESRSMPLWRERILVVLPEHHPLTQQNMIYWTDLRNETVLLSHYDPGREIEDLLFSKLISADHRPKIERHDVSRGIIKSLVGMNAGISLVLESDVGAILPGLAYKELNDGSGPTCLGYNAYWRTKNENPALASFLSLLAERFPLVK